MVGGVCLVDDVDRLLLREYGRRSPAELETLTGVPALEVAQRLERVLGERDFLGARYGRAISSWGYCRGVIGGHGAAIVKGRSPRCRAIGCRSDSAG